MCDCVSTGDIVMRGMLLALAAGLVLAGCGQASDNSTHASPPKQPAYQAQEFSEPFEPQALKPEVRSATRIGDSYFFEDGTTATRIGDSTFYSDGTTATRVGDTTFFSDSTMATRVGDHTFYSDGTTATRIGDHTFLSNGTTCTTIGESTFCN